MGMDEKEHFSISVFSCQGGHSANQVNTHPQYFCNLGSVIVLLPIEEYSDTCGILTQFSKYIEHVSFKSISNNIITVLRPILHLKPVHTHTHICSVEGVFAEPEPRAASRRRVLGHGGCGGWPSGVATLSRQARKPGVGSWRPGILAQMTSNKRGCLEIALRSTEFLLVQMS